MFAVICLLHIAYLSIYQGSNDKLMMPMEAITLEGPLYLSSGKGLLLSNLYFFYIIDIRKPPMFVRLLLRLSWFDLECIRIQASTND